MANENETSNRGQPAPASTEGREGLSSFVEEALTDASKQLAEHRNRDELAVERFRKGDKTAFDDLIRWHVVDLYETALRRAHDREIAKTAVELTFLTVYGSLTNISEPFDAWLYRHFDGLLDAISDDPHRFLLVSTGQQSSVIDFQTGERLTVAHTAADEFISWRRFARTLEEGIEREGMHVTTGEESPLSPDFVPSGSVAVRTAPKARDEDPQRSALTTGPDKELIPEPIARRTAPQRAAPQGENE